VRRPAFPGFRRVHTREFTIKSAEERILSSYQDAPRVFSMLLNLFCHVLAIGEVYLIIRMIGASSTLLGCAHHRIAHKAYQCRWSSESG
jgi:hypothetical protein